jgi:hypothetical protein
MGTPNPPANDGHSGSARPVGDELLPEPDSRIRDGFGRQPATQVLPQSGDDE